MPIVKTAYVETLSFFMAVAGIGAINAIRIIVGPTKGYEADAGSIRGDYSLSTQSNVVHASDSKENAEIEINRFFNKDEILDYNKLGLEYIFAEHLM